MRHAGRRGLDLRSVPPRRTRGGTLRAYIAVDVLAELGQRGFGEGGTDVGDNDEIVFGLRGPTGTLGDFALERALGAFAGGELDVGRGEHLAGLDQPGELDRLRHRAEVATPDRGPCGVVGRAD